MAWNSGQNAGTGNIRSENQYLLQPAPNKGSPTQNQLVCSPQTSGAQEEFYNIHRLKNILLKNLLTPQSQTYTQPNQTPQRQPEGPTGGQDPRQYNVAYKDLPDGAGNSSAPDYVNGQNAQQVPRADYRYNYSGAVPQTQPQLQTVPGAQQSYRSGGYRYPQARALHPAQKQEKLPAYSSHRQQTDSVSAPYMALNKKHVPSQSQKGLQQLKWTNYIPSSFGGRNPGDCIPNQQRPLMHNMQTGPVQTSPMEHQPPSALNNAVPTQSYNDPTMRNATPTFNVQNGQMFPSQNYPSQPVQSGQPLPNQSQNYPVQSGQPLPNQSQNYPVQSGQPLPNQSQNYPVQSGQPLPNQSQNYPVQSGQPLPNQSQNYPVQSGQPLPNQSQNYPVQSGQPLPNQSQNYPVQSGQPLHNQSQNYPPQPVQKSLQQPYAYPPEQTSGAPPLQSYNGPTSSDAKKHDEILMLLNVYRKVKRDLVQIYMERKLERQTAHLSNSAAQQTTNSTPSGNPHVMPTALTSNAQAAMGPTSGRATDQQNAPHGAPPQVMNKGNQLYACQSQNLDTSSQNVAPDMRNVVAQNNYSLSVGYLNSTSALSHPNQSFNPDSSASKATQGRAMQSSLDVLSTTTALPQASRENTSHQFASNVNVGRQCGAQGGLPKQADFPTTPQAHGEAPHPQANLHIEQGCRAVSGVGLGRATGHPDTLKGSLPTVAKENEDVLSGSLEALETCLSLWKSQNTCSGSGQPLSAGNVPTLAAQSSDQSKTVSKESPVGATDASDLPGSAFGIPGFSQEASANGLSKAMEPQIAIVSPLVQSKMKSRTHASPAGTPEQCPVIEEGSICSLSSADGKGTLPLGNVADTTAGAGHGGYKVQLLKEFNAVKAVMDDLEVIKSLDKTLLHGGLADCLSVPKTSISESESEPIIQTSNHEREGNEDGSLQISGICSLVEGNSFYDSAIAMMFGDAPLEGKDDIWSPEKDMDSYGGNLQDKTDLKQEVCVSSAMDETSLDYNSEQSVTDISIEGLESGTLNSQGSQVVMSNEDHDVEGSQMEQSPTGLYGGDLCSAKVSDQLSDLLSEFPFGIESYTSEKRVENVERCGDKVEQASPPPPIKKELPVVEKDSVPNEDLPLLKKEKEERPLVERVSSPFMEMLESLENMDELPSKDVLMDRSSEGVYEDQSKETCSKNSNLDQKETEQSLKQEIPDKNLFCCLFSWLTHAYGGAPKCSCKLPGRENTEQPAVDSANDKTSPVKLEDSETLKGFVNDKKFAASPVKDEDSKTLTAEPLQEKLGSRSGTSPNVKCQIANGGNGGTLAAANVVCKQEPSADQCEPPASCAASNVHSDAKLKRSESWERKNSGPSRENKESVKPHGSESKKRHRDGSGQKAKSEHSASRKGEKLIVKTDFLKNRNYKDRKKHWQEMKSSRPSVGRAEKNHLSKAPSSEGSAQLQHSNRTPFSERSTERTVSKSAVYDAVKRPVSGEVVGNDVRPPQEVKPQNHTADPALKNAGMDKPIVASGSESKPKETPRPLKSKDEKRVIEIQNKKVLSVQEYLQRKRNLNDIRSKRHEQVSANPKGPGAAGEKHARPDWPKVGPDGNKHRMSNVKMRKSPAKAKNLSLKPSVEQAALAKSYKRLKKERDKIVSYGANSPRIKGSSRNSPSKRSSSNLQDPRKPAQSKDKIYLSPCVAVKRPSHESISLTKLEIRPSPDLTRVKPAGRRKSLESGTPLTPPSKKKHTNSPKMLEFKLFPELLLKSPLSQNHMGDSKAAKEKSKVEGIKSKKEAWYKDIPFKKRRLESAEEQGDRTRPPSPGDAPTCSATDKDAARHNQDSRATFDNFKKLYLEKKSKSLDASLPNHL